MHVSADNRYRLFVNGTSLALARRAGTWITIAPQLKAGNKVPAKVVWAAKAHR
jgi:hypothetical protein